MKKSVVHVSDHALLRYLERALDLDVEWYRRNLGRRLDQVMLEGATGLRIDGLQFRIQEGVVVTVVKINRPDPKTGRQRRDRDE